MTKPTETQTVAPKTPAADVAAGIAVEVLSRDAEGFTAVITPAKGGTLASLRAKLEAKGKVAFAGKEQRKKPDQAKRLPVPPPKSQESVLDKNPKPTTDKRRPATKPSKPAPKKVISRGGGKIDLIAGMLKRKNGCTRAEVLAAIGWKAVNLLHQAKQAGLKIRAVKDGKVLRYIAI